MILCLMIPRDSWTTWNKFCMMNREIPGLPRVPLYVLLWHGYREVPARAVIGIDDQAHFHLDLAGVFALTHLFLNRLCRDILKTR